jgi:glutamate-1-semialdehyde 2,1-aminomutase
MKVVAIVQARMGSTRLPGKVMKPICGVPMIELLLERLGRAKQVHQIVVATPDDDSNAPLVHHVQSLGLCCVQGSEKDVLARYLLAAKHASADIVVRITGDCPLVDPQLVDAAVEKFKSGQVDYLSNTDPPTLPDGLDIEVFSTEALERAACESQDAFDHEHVTPYLRRSPVFRRASMRNEEDLSSLRWTVDEPEDLSVVATVFEHFKPDIHFSWKEVLEMQRSEPGRFDANRDIERNEGASMGTGQKLWKRAKKIIPGGNMLLSKRAEMFLPELWPAYFSKAKGCQVWDLDGNAFIDMSIMGVGTNSLGYGHPEVDAAVVSTVTAGNMSTLNCPEEVYLSEKLIELHPWADMVKLARSGGEANAVAIRIARAASGRHKVAFCGYHGWHDWYLSANLGDGERLAGHLLPGLNPKGVPQNLSGTVFPFTYNNFAELEALVNEHDIGVIKMEVSRNKGPEDHFLHKVRQLATERGIVLIFDECTSGFRQTFGGLHKLYGVEPDMAMFGKALGNGYAITATIGRREVMEAAQSTFISSTFWTERIGPAAALKTLEVMERTESWTRITNTGSVIRARWQALADSHDVVVNHWGLPALAGFTFASPHALIYKTFITQEMLKKGFLASNAIYVSTAHEDTIVDQYFDALDPVFSSISACEKGMVSAEDLLDGPVCHGGFKRLN